MTDVHVVVPAGIDDPARPSGGNRYDRRLCAELVALGWTVHELPVPGDWPRADAAAHKALAALVGDLPDGALLLVDGLIGAAAPAVLVPAATRLRLVVVVHLPLGVADPTAGPGEASVLRAAAGVVCTSDWTRRWLAARYGPVGTALGARGAAAAPLRARVAAADPFGGGGVVVAVPGADPADRAEGSAGGGELLCVGAVLPHKGQDVLVAALATITELDWRCRLVGATDLDPAFAYRLRAMVDAAGIADRVSLTGPLAGVELDRALRSADLLVVPSRIETYGMTVVEALARGVPVVAADVGGVPEALGAVGGERPGLLVRPDDATALAAALRCWLTSTSSRDSLRAAAARRRETLVSWRSTTADVEALLVALTAGESVPAGVST